MADKKAIKSHYTDGVGSAHYIRFLAQGNLFPDPKDVRELAKPSGTDPYSVISRLESLYPESYLPTDLLQIIYSGVPGFHCDHYESDRTD